MTYLLPSSTPIYSFLPMIQNASGMYLLCLIVIHFKMTWYIYSLGIHLRWNIYSSMKPNVSFLESAQISTINGTPIQVVDCHRDLGIFMSCDLKWSNHLKYNYLCSSLQSSRSNPALFSPWFAHLGKEELVPFASSFSINLCLSDLETPPFEGYYCT